jgi:hypothetical protein
MSGHRILQDSYKANHQIPDPGPGGNLLIDRDLAIFYIGSASAEARNLPDPFEPGMIATIVAGALAGTVTITAASSINTTGNTHIALSATRQMAQLVSVPVTTGSGYAWAVTGYDGATLS